MKKVQNEVEQIMRSIKKAKPAVIEADTKIAERREMEAIKKDLKEITGLKRVTSKLNLFDYDLEKKDMEEAQKKLKRLKELADFSQKNRKDANLLAYEGVEKDLKKLEKILAEVKSIDDPLNSDDLERSKRIMEEYYSLMDSIAYKGYKQNAFTTDLRRELESQNQTRQSSTTLSPNTLGSKLEMDALADSTNEAFKVSVKLNRELNEVGDNSTDVSKTSKEIKEVADNAEEAAKDMNKANTEMSKSKQAGKDMKNAANSSESLADSFKRMAR